MIFRILFCTLVIGASFRFYLNQMCGKREYFQTSDYLITNVIGTKSLPSLYEADIDALTKGLKSKELTSVDLIKASHLTIFE
jgi:hypothetical protein